MKIVRLASRGDGVLEDGRHVPLTAPGDEVDEAGQITPGPHHQAPPCRHFPECGGCQLQHVDDAAYADFVTDRIASALAAQGIGQVDLRPPHLSPPNSRRRATLHWTGSGGAVAIGFKAARSHRVVDMRENHILRPELLALVAPLRRLLNGRGRAGEAGLTLTDQGVDLTLSGAKFEGLPGADAITAFAQEQRLARLSLDDGLGAETRWEPQPVTVTLGGHPQRHPGEGRDPYAGPSPDTAQRLGPGLRRGDADGVPVPFPPNAFLQATADGEAALVAAVLDAIGPARATADLFAGLGTFAFALPGRVYAAEGAQDAALSLKAAANRSGRQLFVDHRDLFRRPLTTAELDRFEAVVLDPPRAGAKEQVAELARASVPRIAYASCNPATFARDAATLVAGGYRLDWIQPVGQFRWSTHVELVASFSR